MCAMPPADIFQRRTTGVRIEFRIRQYDTHMRVFVYIYSLCIRKEAFEYILCVYACVASLHCVAPRTTIEAPRTHHVQPLIHRARKHQEVLLLTNKHAPVAKIDKKEANPRHASKNGIYTVWRCSTSDDAAKIDIWTAGEDRGGDRG